MSAQTTPRPMPIREFVALEKIARKALKAGDYAGIDRVNERLADVNLRLEAHDGKLYVRNLTPTKGTPDVPDRRTD